MSKNPKRANKPLKLDKSPSTKRGGIERKIEYDKKPVYSFLHFDTEHDDHPFNHDSISNQKVFNFLRTTSNKTWHDLINAETTGARKRNKWTAIESLTPQAQRRLNELPLDGYIGEQLFRFRVSKQERLWGMIHGHVFSPIWWDPEHVVCPSEKN